MAILISYLLAVRLKSALGELWSPAQYSWRVRETIYGVGKTFLPGQAVTICKVGSEKVVSSRPGGMVYQQNTIQ
ncbi:MAG: hypothetical protein WBV36_09230 [Terriglobales bacterium]